MFNYQKYSMNAWVYGMTFLVIFMLPLLYVALISFVQPSENIFNDAPQLFDTYLQFCLFPRNLIGDFMMELPYVGFILLIPWYFLHLHIYSWVVERTITFLLTKTRSRKINVDALRSK